MYWYFFTNNTSPKVRYGDYTTVVVILYNGIIYTYCLHNDNATSTEQFIISRGVPWF